MTKSSDSNEKNPPQSVEEDNDREIEREQRRKALRGILASGGLIAGATSDKWSKPILRTSVLPAHAISTSPTIAVPRRR